VLLFHFQVPGFQAGFIGVDLFFVLSGFLMMAIIKKGLEQSSFSLIGFYLARARRILPALSVVVVALLVLGWFWLPTPDYKALGTQSFYTMGFLSNWQFWQEAGYFDAAAHEKWLLHTWSLGVEAQFYLLFPLFLLLLWKLRSKESSIWIGLIVAFGASFALSAFASSRWSAASFYLLPTRGWELLAGALIFMISTHAAPTGLRSTLTLTAGWLLLALSMVTISDQTPWPGVWSLLPVLGAAAILLAQNNQSILCNNSLIDWLGSRSYSLYLWHWPLMVALHFASLNHSVLWTGLAALMSLVAAELSYRLVETPLRTHLKNFSPKQQIVLFFATISLVTITALGVRFLDLSNRLPPAVQKAALEAENIDPRRDECLMGLGSTGSPGCLYGSGEPSVVLLGDSHAASVATALGEVLETRGESAILWALGGFRMLEGARYFDAEREDLYHNFQKWINKQLMQLPPSMPIVVVGRYSFDLNGSIENPQEAGKPRVYFDKKHPPGDSAEFQRAFQEALITSVCQLSKRHDVYLMRPIPEMRHHVPNRLSRDILFRGKVEDIKITKEAYHDRQRVIWEAQDKAADRCGVAILDPLLFLCDDSHCYGSREGRPLYFDDDHLSEHGNKFLIPMFETIATKNSEAISD
jgi:peptidoglycan/LPS O-acetylase OafA/YrhL